MTVDPAIFEQSRVGYESRRERIKAAIALEAAKYGVTYNEVMSPCRHRGGANGQYHYGPTKPIIQARFACMTMVRDTYNMSYPHIGKLFGKDHTSVMHAIKRHRTFYGVAT
jgi:chromosomal replication initiation ATPase DnaA